MDWNAAVVQMALGKKVKPLAWEKLGKTEEIYFYVDDSTLMFHTPKGMDMRVSDIECWELLMIGADRLGWEVVEDENVPEESV